MRKNTLLLVSLAREGPASWRCPAVAHSDGPPPLIWSLIRAVSVDLRWSARLVLDYDLPLQSHPVQELDAWTGCLREGIRRSRLAPATAKPGSTAVVVANLHYPGLTPDHCATALSIWDETRRPVITFRQAHPHPLILFKRYSKRGRFAGFGKLPCDQWKLKSNSFVYQGREYGRHRQNYPPVYQAVPALFVGPPDVWLKHDRLLGTGRFTPFVLRHPADLDVTVHHEQNLFLWWQQREESERRPHPSQSHPTTPEAVFG